MQTIPTVKNQTFRDLALQLYGNTDAVEELLILNPDVITDCDLPECDLAYPLFEGTAIAWDDTSALINKAVLKELAGETIATYYVPVWRDVNDDFNNDFG